MNIESYIEDHIRLAVEMKQYTRLIDETAARIIAALKADKKIILMGNGGSAADSQHFAAELVGSFARKRKGLPALALSANEPVITSIGNDFGFENVFKRQLEAWARPGDIIIGFSTSGNSRNVIRAFQYAKESGNITIAFLGKDGGELKSLADISLLVPGVNTPHIQEMHLMIYHIICDIIDKEFSDE